MTQKESVVWSEPTRRHVFVDESVRRDGVYRLTAVAVPTTQLTTVGRAVRNRVNPGSNRVHFSSESDQKRRAILRSFANLPIEAVTFVTPYPVRSNEQIARDRCLGALVDLAVSRASELVLDTRGTDRDKADRLAIRRALKPWPEVDLAYSHRGSRDELLLSLPDAIGWAAGAGRRWSELIAGLVTVVDVSA